MWIARVKSRQVILPTGAEAKFLLPWLVSDQVVHKYGDFSTAFPKLSTGGRNVRDRRGARGEAERIYLNPVSSSNATK